MLKPLISMLLIALCAFCYSQAEEVKITAKDVDRFIETYEPLVREFEDLDEGYDGMEDPNAWQVFMANEKIKSILEKYGWNEEFGIKWVAIASAYGFVKMDEEIANLPEDQQEQFRKMMGTQVLPYSVSDEVKKLITSRMDEFDELFDN